MNPENTTIHAWIPAEWRDRLDREAGQRGVTLGTVLREYLERGFAKKAEEDRYVELLRDMS